MAEANMPEGVPQAAIPGATYRLQFREGMDFARAAELAPYLKRLGVTHLYASPVFTAVPGSTHGYDVADFAEIDPVLGGREGFSAMAAALRGQGIGILLDLVPNHMGASTANPYWADILEWGVESLFADMFDIDWTAPKLLVPVLGEPYGEALEAGKLGLAFAPEEGGFRFTYYELSLPLGPQSYARILGLIEGPEFQELSLAFATSAADGAPYLKQRLAELAADPDQLSRIEAGMREVASDRDALHELHEAQAWRLSHWRMARETLTYRRFFEIADLVGVQVDRPSVFDATHALLRELTEAGEVNALRLDHIDGLADPKAYLARLGEIEEAPYVVVEKILGPEELLPASWRCAGTTGYEFARSVTAVQVDAHGLEALDAAWRDATGEDRDFDDLLAATKRTTLTYNLAGELAFLTESAREIGEGDPSTRDFGPDSLRRAIIEMAAAFPVYRAYVDHSGPSDQDRKLVLTAGEVAKTSSVVEDPEVVDFLVRILLLDLSDPELAAKALYFARRFQQTTGPIMAKALEDTLFYRFNRLIALNEVGGEPDAAGPEAFHEAMEVRLGTQPAGLSATATHDTKRGEDARARIAAVSQMAGEWTEAVARWNSMLAPLIKEVEDGAAPEPNMVWLFHQALLGGWEADLSPEDRPRVEALGERLAAFTLKAVREAKERTSWTAPNEPYETALTDFVKGALSRPDYLSDFLSVTRPLFAAGAVNSLAQLALKLTAPGVPDVYQGTELWDLSFVDPDNRRPVDFALRVRMIGEAESMDFSATLPRWREGLPKLWLMQRLLGLRAEHRDVFLTGSYEPLAVEGPMAARVLAFARRQGDRTLVVAVPRLPLDLIEEGSGPVLKAEAFAGTTIRLPEVAAPFENLLSGGTHAGGDRIGAGKVFSGGPVAILASIP
ncbi:malto-oligosyltrehalose synthase [Afifella sp. IM 167]|uniref:malto-oligosyltrehalose synthase n=1 Tax=Afifella sp. IM 167 TaxID=2033586 RepID=UPI001CCAB713|nr:malto-oligosyltrehalose synthase [Afifella sp. IM 167]MBZ8132939.1 malto-oligosyltrehalose synthase [Afifella sp. IM 167]